MSTATAPRSSAFANFPLPQPPEWLKAEVQQRIVLLLNHILQQEPEALERLKRQKGQVAAVKSNFFAIELIATPAGLLDLAKPGVAPDLTLTVLDDTPLTMLQTLLGGGKPRMEIAGDVMLAAEVNWLVDHVRWDVEEDLSRILGDVPAHTLMQALRGAGETVKRFVAPKGQAA
jgi:ubiquinone biosynthesis accessory factor UbiJ